MLNLTLCVMPNTTQIDLVLLEELYGHLLTQETHIEHNTPSVDVPAANLATRNNASRPQGSPSSRLKQPKT